MAETLTMCDGDEERTRKLRLLAAEHDMPGEVDFWAVAARLRAATANRRHTPAADLVREGRDER